MLTLRDYQEKCVELVLAAYAANTAGVELIVLPTGAGKTVVFAEVIRRLNELHGLNTLIIAHRDELLDQAADKYRMIKPTAVIGKVGGGIAEYGGEVTVASVATISRPKHLKQLRAIGYALIIVDEAHHVAASGYQKVLEALPDSFKLFVTATPDRLDNKPVLADKEPLYSASIVEMVQQKYLCEIRAIAIRTEVNLDEVKSLGGDFQLAALDSAVNTPARNRRVVLSYLQHAEGRRAICFCVTISHAQALASVFNEVGIAAACVTGDTPLDERKKLYQGLHDGTILILCNVQVLTEGFDEPLVSCVIMARPTQSRALYVQCIGRGLRLAPDKQDCIILDLTDNSTRHRLKPQKLSAALGKDLKDNETIAQMEEREKAEALAEKQKLIHKINERREQDKVLDLLNELPRWQELPNGVFRLEIGNHKIAIVPSKNMPGQYHVDAKLAPTYERQRWMSNQALDWCQAYAEQQARKILEDPKNIRLVDSTQPWKSLPASEPQKDLLRRYKIAFDDTVTKGQASQWIDEHKVKLAQKKAAIQAGLDAKKKALRETISAQLEEAIS